MSDTKEITGQDRKRYSWAVIMSVPLGLLFFLPLGMLGIVFVVLGLWQTRGGRMVGRGAAWGGLLLWLVCLSATTTGCPATVLSPLLFEEDRQLQRFLDDIAEGRFEQAYNSPEIECANVRTWALGQSFSPTLRPRTHFPVSIQGQVPPGKYK